MLKLAIANQKGGVGKTTTSYILAQLMRGSGYRVLMVDSDGQGNLGRLAQGDSKTPTLFDVLNGTPAAEAVQDAPGGFIIASDARLSSTNRRAREMATRLQEAFNAVSGDFDVMVIDTQPSLSPVTLAAIAAADSVIVPARLDRFSVDGLRQFGTTITALKQELNPQLSLLGVIGTNYQRSTNIHRAVIPALRAQAELLNSKLYEPPIRRSIAVEELQYTPGDLPKCAALDDYRHVLDRIIKDTGIKKGRA